MIYTIKIKKKKGTSKKNFKSPRNLGAAYQ